MELSETKTVYQWCLLYTKRQNLRLTVWAKKKKKKIDAIKMNLSFKKNQIEVLEPKIKKK